MLRVLKQSMMDMLTDCRFETDILKNTKVLNQGDTSQLLTQADIVMVSTKISSLEA